MNFWVLPNVKVCLVVDQNVDRCKSQNLINRLGKTLVPIEPESYSQPRSRVNSISKNEMNIRISLCNVRRVNGMLDISLEIVPKKTH